MQLRTFLRSKIHGATVTGANVDYVGSIEIDRELMTLSGLDAGELVHVWDIDNADRFETYVLEAPAGSGTIALNGAAAKRVAIGDKIIIAAFVLTDEMVIPRVVIVDRDNRAVDSVTGK